MSQAAIKEAVLGLLAVLVLAGFIWLFGEDLWNTFRGTKSPATPSPAAEVENPRVYVATAIATLVGGVSAVFLGVEGTRARLGRSEWRAADYIRVVYVLIYAAFGTAAVVAWIIAEGGAPLSLRNLAVTFLGLLTPAVAGYLGAKSGKT